MNVGCIVFLQEYKKDFLYIAAYGVNSLKDSSMQMVHSIEFKFRMYIIGHDRTKGTDFGEFLMHSSFTGVQKRILIHYGLWSQIL